MQRSFINGDFEVPAPGVSTACNALVDADNVPGWETTHSAMPASVTSTCSYSGLIVSTGRIIEIWGNSFQGEQPRTGVQAAELNAVEESSIYQKICINNGEDVAWSFAHKARSATAPNQMAFVVGPTVNSILASNLNAEIANGGIVKVKSYANGTGSVMACQTGSNVGTNSACTVSSYTTPNGTKWMDYAGNFRWNGTGGDMYVAFGAILGDDPTKPSLGSHIDNVRLTLKPYIEFYPSAGVVSNAESVANPSNFGLRTTGEFTSPLLVSVTVTGGTATLGTDFTTPSGTATFDVTVPVGNYDGTSIIPLGITILNDSILESDETITFSVSTSASYQVASTSTCGASPNSTSSITITDDDAAKFSIKKIAKFVSGSSYDFGFTASNGGPTSTSNINVTASDFLTTTLALTEMKVTANNTSIVITETQPSSNWLISGVSCIDVNAANSGNVAASNLASFNSVSSVITIPSSVVISQANIVCTVTNEMIDATNDSVSTQPNITTTTDVSSNDSKISGSVYTQQSTTCSPAGTMSSAGLASYTTPAANSSCTVIALIKVLMFKVIALYL